MALKNHIDKIKEGLRQGVYTSEAAVSQGILLPTLNELGWPVFDTSIVIPEYSLSGRRVDFALCNPANKPSIFIEVKKVGLFEGADRQLFEYSFHEGVPMCILTDGQEWSFYLPGEQGHYDERRVYKLDILERETLEIEKRFNRYLTYDKVCNGEALKAARSDYQNVSRGREIETTFPKAWASLLEEQDSLLLELLADKVEDICGYKPNLENCSDFIEKKLDNNISTNTSYQSNKASSTYSTNKPKNNSRARKPRPNSFTFKGKIYSVGSARETMTKIFQLFAIEDSTFLERFASRKHGKKRRYLSQDRLELYPGRPDLMEEASVEIVKGWWMGTNLSRNSMKKIIEIACEVVGKPLSDELNTNLD